MHLTPGAVRAGESARLEWAFAGAGERVRHLRVWLEAVATRTHRTDSGVRKETAPLDTPTIEVLDRGRELPRDYGAIDFEVPVATPPSAEGELAVRWRLKLHGEIDYWPDVAADYEIRVLPPAE